MGEMGGCCQPMSANLFERVAGFGRPVGSRHAFMHAVSLIPGLRLPARRPVSLWLLLLLLA